MLKHFSLFFLLFLFSCNTPEARLEHLQHIFWEKFAAEDFFEIKLKNEVLHLPLPSYYAPSEHQKSWVEGLQKEANCIEKEQLSAENQRQLEQLRGALEDRVTHTGKTFFDPSRCVVLKHLQQFSAQPELPLLLEKIPSYYVQIEQRWQIPDTRFLSKAVAESQNTLDLLEGMKINASEEMITRAKAAQAAVKDFIGLCQSTLLQ